MGVSDIKKRLKEQGYSGDVGRASEHYGLDTLTSDGKYRGSSSYQKIKDRVKNEGVRTDSFGVDQKYIDSFINDANSYISSAQNDYNAMEWKTSSSVSSSRADSYSDLYNRGQRVLAYVKANKGNLDKEDYDSFISSMESTMDALYGINNTFAEKAGVYAKYKSEEDYNNAIAYAEDVEEKTFKYNLETGSKEIESWEGILGEAQSYLTDILDRKTYLATGNSHSGVENYSGVILDEYKSFMGDLYGKLQRGEIDEETYNRFKNNNYYKYGLQNQDSKYVKQDELEDYIQWTIDSKEGNLNNLLAPTGYGNVYDLEKGVKEKKLYHQDAERLQYLDHTKWWAESAKDFELVTSGASVIGQKDLADKVLSAKQTAIEASKTAAYNSNRPNNTELKTESVNAKNKYDTLLAEYESLYGSIDNEHYLRYMEEDELKAYTYYIKQGDTETANAYLNRLKDDLTQREGREIYEQMNDNIISEILFRGGAGIEQHFTGIGNYIGGLFGLDPDPTSATQYASQLIDEDLADIDLKWYNFKTNEWNDKDIFGKSLGQVLGDVAYTTGNQLPSIIVGSVTGGVGGAISMGISAAGNGYADFLKEGYSKEQAMAYGTMSGLLETTLSYAISGITSLGGKVSGGLVNHIANKFDSAFARVAIKIGGNMISEGLEESLQEILDPWLKTLATGEFNWESPTIDEVLYAGLLGALSAGMLEGTGTIVEAVKTKNAGKVVQNAGMVDRLVKVGSTFSADSVAYKIASKVNENTGAYTIGRLLNEVNATLTQQNVSDIVFALESKGVSSKDANTIAQYIGMVVEGQALTEKQASILENNDVVSEVMLDVIINQNSTVNQRIKGFAEVVSNVNNFNKTTSEISQADVNTVLEGYSSPESTKAEELTNSPTKEESPGTAEIQSYFDGKTRLIADNSEVTVENLDSIKDGESFVRLDNGNVVSRNEVQFGKNEEGLVYDTVVDLGLGVDNANIIIQDAKQNVKGLNENGTISIEDYIEGVRNAYLYGNKGFAPVELTVSKKTNYLSEASRKVAYNEGRTKAIAEAKETQKAFREMKSKVEEAKKVVKNKKTPIESTDSVRFHEMDKSGLTGRQKTSVDFVERIAKVFTKSKFVFFASYKDANGKRVYKDADGKIKSAPSGKFLASKGEIWIDINAGNLGNGLILFTASHELTHFAKKFNPEQYKAFTDFLMKQYGKLTYNGKRVSVDLLVSRQIEKAKNNGREISYDEAFDEVVADSCERFLMDSNAIRKLSADESIDKGTVAKIKSFIRNLISQVKAWYRGLNPESLESHLVSKMDKESINKLVAMWENMVSEAGENYEALADNMVSNTNTTEDRGEQFALRDTVEETNDLVAVHNMQVSELTKSLDLGGLPMPSIAIIKAQAGHAEYGDVSLVFNKSTIDPEASVYNKVYGGDAWTPTYPAIEFKPNEKIADKISKKYYALAKKFGYDEARPLYNYVYDLENVLNKHKSEEGIIANLSDDTDMMQLFLLDKGKDKIETIQKETRTELSDEQVQMHEFFIKELGEGVINEVIAPEGSAIFNYRKEYLAKYRTKIEQAYSKLMTEVYNFSAEEVQNVLNNETDYNLLKKVRDAYNYRKNGRVTVKTESDYTATKEAIKNAVNTEEYQQWLNDLFKGVIEKSGIRNNKDYFDNYGNTRSWESLHWANNLTNVVKVMRSQNNGDVAFFSGLGIWGVSAKEYQSIDDIRADKGRLQRIPKEEYNAIKESFGERLTEIASSIMDRRERNQFIALDNAMVCIVDAVRSSKTRSGILRNLKQYTQLSVTETTVNDIVALVSDIANMPTEYFEAKPQRAVGFDEVAAVILPDTADANLKNRLNEMGVKSIEYKSGDENARLEALNSIEDVKFSDRDSDGNTLTKAQQEFFKDSKVRDSKGRLQVVYHGTTSEFNTFKRGDIGYHFGSYAQARNRLSYQGGKKRYIKAYLDIKNPLVIEHDSGSWHGNYAAGMLLTWGDFNSNPEAVAKLQEITRMYDTRKSDTELKNFLKSLGYDGIQYLNTHESDFGKESYSYIAFESNQVKEITNLKPTSNSDTRYSDRDSYSELDEWFDSLSLEEFNELISGDVSIDDISEELNVEPKKIEILFRRKGLGESHIEENRTAVMKQKRIDEAIKDSGAKFNPDYARKYITRISTKDFIDLTVSQEHIDRGQFDASVKGDHGNTMSNFDYEKALQDSQSPYIHIDRSTGRVIAHNGRHRIRALEKAGIESVEIEVQFFDEEGYLIKYNANTIPDMAISSQFDTAIETHLSTIIPLNEAHRAEIERTYGEKAHVDAGVKYSDRYSYETLTSKPDMRVTTVAGNVPNNRADVVALAKKNATAVGKTKKDGSVYVRVDDIGEDVLLGTDGLKHGLQRTKDPKTDPNYIVTLKAGEILKHSIRINELTPAKENASGSYVLIGAAKATNGELYIVRSIVNQFSNELSSMDVLYAINAKKESAVLNAPRSTENPLSVTDSTISIADLLGYVNQFFPDILPESVLRHYGYDARPDGAIGESVLYQDRDSDSMSNRYLLANALETAVTNDIEKNKLAEYKKKIDLIEKEERRLSEIRDQLFGKTEMVSEKTRKDLQFEMKQASNRINTYDKQLLNLESTSALKKVLEREKRMAYKRAEQKGRDAVAKQREKNAETVRKLMDKYQQQRKDAVNRIRETRDKNDAKDKLQKLVLQTAKWISYPAKDDVKCPDILRQPYADFLKSIDLSSKRKLEGGEDTKNDLRIASAMDSLATAIEKIKVAQDPSITTDNILDSGYLDLPAEFVEKLREMAESVKGMMVEGDHIVNQMSSGDIKALSQLIRTLNHAIKEMSTLYNNLRFAKVEELGDNSMTFMDSMGEAKGTNGVADFVGWDNALPYYAFQRFGEGGESVFEELMDAQDQLAYHAKTIFEFKDKNWTDKEADGWSKDTHTIELTDGKTATGTTADFMGVYCLSRREQAVPHLLGGGIRIIGSKKGTKQAQDSRTNLTDEDIKIIVNSLSERQIKVANAIQEFMSTVCADWGNEISMKRFLTEEFTEKFYYPIESNDENLAQKDPQAKQSDLYRLLNISATKPTVKGANNEVIIRNIFDVFTNHASDMARLNAYGMALLDYMKWLNYREKIDNADGSFKVRGVVKSMGSTYGDKAKSYVVNLIKDINGRSSDGKDHPWLMEMTRMAKTASVGGSLRVAMLQVTAYPRAAMVLSMGSLAKGLTKVPSIRKAQQYCGIALWKSFGFYDTNIARSIEDQIRGAKNIRQKIIELSLKGAEWADAVTWGALWNACEYEVAKTTKNKVGSEEFYQEVGKKLREVVYATQVVDSTLTRTQIMRSKSGLTQTATAFMSEPSLTHNILMNAAFQFHKEKRISGSAKVAWKKTGKLITKTISVYSSTALLVAIMESLADAYRDDDDEEFIEKFKEAFTENSISNIVPFNNIPIISDFANLILSQFDIGYFSSDRLDTTWLTQANDAIRAWKEVIAEWSGEKETSKTPYNAIYNTVRALSSVTGLPIANLMREVVTLWNNTAGEYDPTLKIKMYESTDKELRKLLYEAITEEKGGDRIQNIKDSFEFEDEDAYESALKTALRENDSRIHEAAQAYYEGDLRTYEQIVNEIAGEGYFDEEIVVGAVRSEVSAIKKKAEEGTSKPDTEESKDTESSIYKASDINTAFESGDTAFAKEIIADLVETKKANGMTEKEAKSSLRSSMTSYWKPLYKQAYKNSNSEEMRRIRYILYNSGLYGTGNDVVETVQGWLKDN